MFFRMIYDEDLAQAAYLIGCPRSGEAIVIDPERDVDRYLTLAAEHGLRITAVAETHIHADFLSGARELAELGAKVYVSDEGGADWKYQWLNRSTRDEPYEHQLLRHGDRFAVGNIDFRVVHTPGHTPEHIAFLVTDRGSGVTQPIGMVTGDFVFVGDLGRPDLLETAAGNVGAMEPAARRLYQTLSTLEPIPDFVQVWPAHGAGSACGKALGAVPTSTIGYEKRFNPALKAATSEQQFVDYILAGQPEPPLYFANMKRDNKVGPKVLGGVPSPPEIEAPALLAIDSRQSAILDTRPWRAYREGHLPGSLSFPLGRTFSTDVGSLVAEDEGIYLIVAPDRLESAVRSLIRIGLDDLRGWFDANALDELEARGVALATLPEVSPQEARTLLEDSHLSVLDVRRATEFAEGHLPRAKNIAHTRLASRLDELPKNRRWLVNCRSGKRSARACSWLQRRGYSVVNLEGGMLAWERTEREQPTS